MVQEIIQAVSAERISAPVVSMVRSVKTLCFQEFPAQ